ncbi:uncharacterized protein LOC124939038 [Impatiens glandulifera]|uniref:uncharacterized protein LOC124939038 n=1 Tax=Impatiens glandulifera TaxID=253017 RepID=UPI001FB182CB|nr:uncharacterized protein LOC124939038 [Impatiens glandulifera]
MDNWYRTLISYGGKRNQELEEQQGVRYVLKEGDYVNSYQTDSTKTSFSITSRRTHLSAARMIPRSTTSNLAKDPKSKTQQSAPMVVPDWSKVSHLEDEDDDENDVRIPPHEWSARAMRNKWSFSVCEGAGRTLKGRDLMTVRNAILTRTGFLE